MRFLRKVATTAHGEEFEQFEPIDADTTDEKLQQVIDDHLYDVQHAIKGNDDDCICFDTTEGFVVLNTKYLVSFYVEIVERDQPSVVSNIIV